MHAPSWILKILGLGENEGSFEVEELSKKLEDRAFQAL